MALGHGLHGRSQVQGVTTGNRDTPVGTQRVGDSLGEASGRGPAGGSLTQASPLHDGMACVECSKIYLNWFPEF